MLYKIQEIKNLLWAHDYLPIIGQMGDGVIVKLPRPRRAFPTISLESYAIARGRDSGLFYNSNLAPEERFVSLSEYAIRLFVLSSVIACCRRVPISESLICYLDEGGRERANLEDIVGPPSTEEGCEREGFLITLCTEARKDGFPAEFEEVAITHGVYEGYRLVKSFF